MLQWHIKGKEVKVKVKEIELRRERNVEIGNQVHIPGKTRRVFPFQRLVQIFFKKEQGNFKI